MNIRITTIALALLLAGMVIVIPVLHTTAAAQTGQPNDGLTPIQKRLLSGFASLQLDQENGSDPQSANTYFPRGSGDCTLVNSSNVKVNQDCLNLSDPDLQGRGQAQNETSIAQDPNQPNHIVASYNDYRRGDGTCGVSWSTDKGRTWNDSTVPNNFVRGQRTSGGAREYYQAGGDTSVAWDSKGNAYLSCQMFKRGPAVTGDPDFSNGLYVFRSTQNFGASFNFPARPVFENSTRSGLPIADKQLMTIDNNSNICPGSLANPGSKCTPFQDRIYVTWTQFALDGTAYIYESYSSDYGEHFGLPHLVSGNSSFCPNTFGVPTPNGNCNENQFSQPFVGPDGVLYVVWDNFNNAVSALDNRNQILIARSFDGGNTFEAPHKVADYYELPDCATYQGGHDFGRACIPEKGPTTNSIFRATNYPSGAVNPTNPKQVVVAFGSYINLHSNESNGCVPTGFNPATGQNRYTGVKTPGACNNDILVSFSNDGGATFTGATTDPRLLVSATPAPGQATTDQWFQWIAFTNNGKLATSYYDRQYGNDEVTGYSDVSLSGSGDLVRFAVQRVTSSSMPFPTQFPESNGAGAFWGDYTGLTAVDNAYPLWSDTRNPDLFACPGTSPGTFAEPPGICTAQTQNGTPLNDQEIYTDAVGVSSR